MIEYHPAVENSITLQIFTLGIHNVAVVHDDFQIAVFIKWIEYKKQKMRIISSEIPFNVGCLYLNKLRVVYLACSSLL
jgi:hypothetical protein